MQARSRVDRPAWIDRLCSSPAAVPDSLSPNDRLGITPAAVGCLTHLGPQDLELRVQPILLVRDPGRIALELLVRFRPAELARVDTGTVVQWAHDLDVVHRLDELVIRRLGPLHQAYRELGPSLAQIDYITVNVSAGSVATAARQDALIAMLRAQRVDPALFRLELAEATAMNLVPAVDELRTVSQRLMEELGFHLLVDDFGSGLSNYRRLCEAWYDTIKLDVGLVRGIARSLRLQTFVGSLIDAVHGLGKTVVAEGVEHHADLEVLLRLGVDALQGYLIARPLPWDALPAFLHDSPWLDPACLPTLRARMLETDVLITAPLAAERADGGGRDRVPLERYVLEHWSSLRSFEEVVLLYVQELRRWGLDLLRVSLAFLPDQEEVDCTQYIWIAHRPGQVDGKRMQRDFLQTAQHLDSVLHHIATQAPVYRLSLLGDEAPCFSFLEELRQLGGSDYLGLRLASRGVSTPVLSICLQAGQQFQPGQIDRIETISSLLSLLFHAFECERASRLSLLDALTQLPNRRSFDSRIRAELVAARTAQSPLSLLLIDVDRFKLVNDSLGHACGDRCLTEVAALLQQQLQRQSDMVARLGGEEFGVVLAHTDHRAAASIAERLREAVAAAVIQHPAPVNGRGLTISIGLASWLPQTGCDPDLDRLLQQADDCLYAAKRDGRDRVVAAALPMEPGP